MKLTQFMRDDRIEWASYLQLFTLTSPSSVCLPQWMDIFPKHVICKYRKTKGLLRTMLQEELQEFQFKTILKFLMDAIFKEFFPNPLIHSICVHGV